MNKEVIEQLALEASFCSNDCFYNPNMMMYQRSNENLTELFCRYDVCDKDVLSC